MPALNLPTLDVEMGALLSVPHAHLDPGVLAQLGHGEGLLGGVLFFVGGIGLLSRSFTNDP
eukprot:15468827-Alexandrium_andersonii.AAC.1